MAEKILTYEEFTGSNERTPEKVHAYFVYLKENGKQQIWLDKLNKNGN